MIAKLVRIKGLVQGVFFRESLRREAEKLAVSGWVRNRSDESVEAFLQGDKAAMEKIISWCYQGPPRAKVESVEAVDAELDEKLNGFARKETY
ncbi:MAG: acylphosphatase [Bdellovibrionota bacterium]